MTPEHLTPDQITAAVDDALRTYPLAPAPGTLRLRVMARLQTSAAPLRFRLQFLDYAVSLFGALMVGLALMFWQTLSPLSARLALLQLGYLVQVLGYHTRALEPAGWVLLITCAAAGGVVLALVSRPRLGMQPA